MKSTIIGFLALVNVFWITTALLRTFLHIPKDTAIYMSIVFIMMLLYGGYHYLIRRAAPAQVESGE